MFAIDVHYVDVTWHTIASISPLAWPTWFAFASFGHATYPTLLATPRLSLVALNAM